MNPEVHTFRAASLQEALQMVRQQLGPRAAVIATRPVRRWGVFPTRCIEVQAACGVATPPRGDGASVSIDGSTDAQVPGAHRPSPAGPSEPREGGSERYTTGRAAEEAVPRTIVDAQTETRPGMPDDRPGDGQTYWEEGAIPDRLPPAMLELMVDLTDHGVPASDARRLLQEAFRRCDPSQRNDPWMIRVAVHGALVRRLSAGGAVHRREDTGRPTVVALIGPTGVGKTTTLAKIAATARFDMGMRVGMVSLDTFRMGAIDQLRQYAELISAPLEVATEPDQLRSAVARLQNEDLVLIDTAGRAPRDRGQHRRLADLLARAQPDSTQLVLSASSSPQHARASLEEFRCVSPTHLIVTKLDEAVGFGAWLPLLAHTRLPISYLTGGQRVPEDIVVATPRRVARELLGLERAAPGMEVERDA